MPGDSPPSSGNIVELAAARSAPAPPAPTQPDSPDTALSGTEDEVALEFSRRHDGQLRWVNPWKTWLRWTGARWQLIETLSVFHAVRRVAREFAKIHQDKKLGKDAATAAIERIARNDPRHDTSAGGWDVDTETFSTPNRKTAL
jgi:D5-like protein